MRKTSLQVLPTFWPPFQKSAIVTLPPPPFTKLLLSSACCKSQWATPSTTRSSLSFLKACGQDFKSQAPAIAVTRFFDREFGPNHPMHFHFHFHLGAQKTISQHTIHLYYIHVFASRFFKCSQVPSPHLQYSPIIPYCKIHIITAWPGCSTSAR